MRYILCTAALAVVLAVTGCGATSALHSRGSAISAISPPAERLVGVFEPDDPGSYGQLTAFSRAAGVAPGVVVYYSNWGMPFASAFAAEAAAHGARTLGADGSEERLAGRHRRRPQDGYLRSYAGAVRSFRRKVIISFGQEMNGTWYPWGSGHAARRSSSRRGAT